VHLNKSDLPIAEVSLFEKVFGGTEL